MTELLVPHKCADCGRTEHRLETNRRMVCSSCRGRLVKPDEQKAHRNGHAAPRGQYQRTANQTLLLAALKLEKERKRFQWGTDELVIESWCLDPKRFGLHRTGYMEQHPDSNKVLCVLLSRKPTSLRGRGLVEKVKSGMYRLTELGRQEAIALAEKT